jgi:hypothetical protein
VQSNGSQLAINVTGLKTVFPDVDELKKVHSFINTEIDLLGAEVAHVAAQHNKVPEKNGSTDHMLTMV